MGLETSEGRCRDIAWQVANDVSGLADHVVRGNRGAARTRRRPGDRGAQVASRCDRVENHVRGAGKNCGLLPGDVHVIHPIPIGSWVGVVGAAAVQPGVIRVRNLVVADHVIAVQRNAPARADRSEQARAPFVFVDGVRVGDVRVTLVLDSDGTSVVIPVAGVPCDVLLGDHLRDGASFRDDIVSRRLAVGVLECVDGRLGGSLDVVDHDHVHRIVVGTIRHGEIRRVCRNPRRIPVIGSGGDRGCVGGRVGGQCRNRERQRKQHDPIGAGDGDPHRKGNCSYARAWPRLLNCRPIPLGV